MRLKREARSAPAPLPLLREFGAVGFEQRTGSWNQVICMNKVGQSLPHTSMLWNRTIELLPSSVGQVFAEKGQPRYDLGRKIGKSSFARASQEIRRTHSETLKLELDILRSNGLEVQKEGQQRGCEAPLLPRQAETNRAKFVFFYLPFPFSSTATPSSSPRPH